MRQRAAVLLFDGDNVLLIHRHRDGREYYVVPGGMIEEGETPEQGALREMQEETGLTVKLDKLLLHLARTEMNSEEYFFASSDHTGDPTFAGAPENAWTSPDDSYELAWIPLSQLGAVPLLPEEIKAHLLAHAVGSDS